MLAERARRIASDPSRMMFGAQAEVANDNSRAIALLCGRRAGKTWWVLLKLISIMQCHPDCRVPYIALTRKSAYGILWTALKRVDKALKLGMRFKEAELEAVLPNGATLFLVGANKSDEIEKLRGQSFPAAAIDEAASFRRSLLQVLVEDVLDAALMDTDGLLILVGTPNAACVGYFYEATTEQREFAVYHWDARDNPHIPHAAAWMERKRKAKKWGPDHPTFRREYLGEWVRDNSLLVYRVDRSRDAISVMPADYAPDAKGWVHVLGADFGYVDACAWVVFAFRAIVPKSEQEHGRRVYCVHAEKKTELLTSQAAEHTKRLIDRYHVSKAVGDAGGLGKPYMEEFRRRFGPSLANADKLGKLATIEAFNDALQTELVKFIIPDAEDYIGEAEILPWDVDMAEVKVGGLVRHEERQREDPRFENHVCDAGLYAFGACTAYMNTIPEAAKPRDPSRDALDDDRDGLDEENESGWIAAQREQRRTRALGL